MSLIRPQGNNRRVKKITGTGSAVPTITPSGQKYYNRLLDTGLDKEDFMHAAVFEHIEEESYSKGQKNDVATRDYLFQSYKAQYAKTPKDAQLFEKAYYDLLEKGYIEEK